MYADRPTKLSGRYDGRPAAHVEFRFNGTNSIENIGIFSLGDLVAFDHSKFWQEKMRLFQWKSRTELGRWVAAGKGQISGSMFRKYADDFETQYKVNGDFVLQNAVIDYRDILMIADTLNTSIVFRVAY